MTSHLLDKIHPVLLEILVIESSSLIASVVSHETPTVQLSSERRVFSGLEVVRKDVGNESLRLDNGERLSSRHPSDNV